MQSVGRDSKWEYKKHVRCKTRPNVLAQQFQVSDPNRVWVSDVTCFKVKGMFYYVCVIIDLFLRKVVAHKVSPQNSTYLITSTFTKAWNVRCSKDELTFHSDQGAQYTSQAFRKKLRMNNVVQSFLKSGSPHDNAVAEAFFSAMKKEELYRNNYKSEMEFKESDFVFCRYFCAFPQKASWTTWK